MNDIAPVIGYILLQLFLDRYLLHQHFAMIEKTFEGIGFLNKDLSLRDRVFVIPSHWI
jgi:hypothetical protein